MRTEQRAPHLGPPWEGDEPTAPPLVRLELEGPLGVGQAAFDVAEPTADQGAVVVEVRLVGRERDGPVEVGGRRGVAPGPVAEHRSRAQERDVGRDERVRLEVGERPVDLAEAAPGEAAHVDAL